MSDIITGSSYWIGIYLLMNNIHFVIYNIIRPIIYVILYFTSYNYYVIRQREIKMMIMNKSKRCIRFFEDNNGNPLGLTIVYGKTKLDIKYFMFIDSISIHDDVMTIISTKDMLTTLLSNDTEYNREYDNTLLDMKDDDNTYMNNNSDNVKNNKLNMVVRCGEYRYIDYRLIEVKLRIEVFDRQQKEIYGEMINLWNSNNTMSVYFWGDKGKGKTYFAYLLAKYMGGVLCTTYNPVEPGNYFHLLYSLVAPTKHKPLIVLIDEVDIMLKNIHENRIERHKHIPTEVYDKMTWNMFLDQFDYGLWNNVILILCSNESDKQIDNMDRSYLREGRINYKRRFI